jgi:two-component system aerobic respiration control sensor histidine kinase ArcB
MEMLEVLEKNQPSLTIQRLKSVINELPGSIYWKDRNGVYLGHNNFAMEKMKSAGFSCDSIIGKTDYDLFPPQVAEQYRAYDLKTMELGKTCSQEEKVILPNGEELIQLSCKAPLRNEQGNIIGVVGNTTDISYLKKIEAELLEAKQRAEKANQVKTELMRHLEHDIRTPFNGIWTLASMLVEKEKNEKKKTYLKDISNSAKELLDYCNNMLELIKNEHEMIPLVQNFNLKTLAQGIIDMEFVAANIKSLDLHLEYEKYTPEIVVGDPNRIQRILMNLCSNAIKYTLRGYVKLLIKVSKKTFTEKTCFDLIVEDSGPGMSKEQQSYFHQPVDAVRSKGQGLRIVRSLVKELKGHIELEKKPGEGTRFICTIPLEIPTSKEEIL